MLKYSNPPLRRGTINLEVENKLLSKINFSTLETKDKLNSDSGVSNGKFQRNHVRRFTAMNPEEIKLKRFESSNDKELNIILNKATTKTGKTKEHSAQELPKLYREGNLNTICTSSIKDDSIKKKTSKESISDCSTCKNSYDNQIFVDDVTLNSTTAQVGTSKIIDMMKKNSKLKNISSKNLIDLCINDLSVIDVHMKRFSSKSISTVNK